MSKLATLLMAVALVAGCKKDKTEDAPKTTTAPADAAKVAAAAADAAAAPAADKPTDGQIVAIVTVANKGDIAAGELAKSKTKNNDVKSFAEMMIKDHGEMITKLTLSYNRARQASITKELLEIIGGAEALKG